MAPVNQCSKCGAPVRFYATEAGWQDTPPRLMPVSVEPVPGGNVLILPAEDGRPPLAHVMKKGEVAPEGAVRYVSHFAECPAAADFRRRR
jgi:hypothetical protein